MVHTIYPSPQEAETGESLNSRPAWFTEQVPRQLELQREIGSGGSWGEGSVLKPKWRFT